jgi:hypothetical protein
MVKAERLNMEETTSIRVLTNNQKEEFALAIKVNKGQFYKAKFGGLIEIKPFIIPGSRFNSLFVILLRFNKDPKLMFDGILNLKDEVVQRLLEYMSKCNKIKIIFINESNGNEFTFEWEHDLQGYFEKFHSMLMVGTWKITQDFESSLRTFRSKIDLNKLWNSKLFQELNTMISQFSSNLKMEQVIEGDLIFLSIDQSEVRNMDFRRIDQAMTVLIDAGIQSRGKLMLTFQGYENTTKEIYEIEEIRQYVKELFANQPSLFYFLTEVEANDQIILNCLLDLQISGLTPFSTQIQVDRQSSKKVLLEVVGGIIQFSRYVEDYSDDFPLKKMFGNMSRTQVLEWFANEYIKSLVESYDAYKAIH